MPDSSRRVGNTLTRVNRGLNLIHRTSTDLLITGDENDFLTNFDCLLRYNAKRKSISLLSFKATSDDSLILNGFGEDDDENAFTRRIFDWLDSCGFDELNGTIALNRAHPTFQRNIAIAIDKALIKSPGCYILYGGSGSGKSTILRILQDGFDFFQSVGEPEPLSSDVRNILREIYAVCLSRILFAASGRQSNTSPLRICIDSWRELVYAAGGNALSGGISSGLLNALTNLSRLCETANVTLVGSLNPMDITNNSDREQGLLDAIKGATSGVIFSLRLGKDDSFSAKLNSRHSQRIDVEVNEVTLGEHLGLSNTNVQYASDDDEGLIEDIGGRVDSAEIAVRFNDAVLTDAVLQQAKSLLSVKEGERT